MKEIFSGFYRFSDDDFSILWKECLFVLDASFLCGLYRLPASASDELLSVLSKVSDRLWVSHHAAMEFQRNRLLIIADQKKKFSEVRMVFANTRDIFKNGLSKLGLKRRHSLIEQKVFEQKFAELFESFEKDLTNRESKQINVYDHDSLLQKIDDLLNGKIGSPPANQAEIDKLYDEAKSRYANRTPPGYADSPKARDEEPIYTYGGIVYRRQYGDLVVWKQLLAQAKTGNSKSVILLTNDVKEDWLWRIGGKTIGPRPELRDEICRLSGVDRFHIYTSEQFLRSSQQYLEVKVSEDSLKAARDMLQWLKRPRISRRFPITGSFPEQVVEEVLPDLVSNLVNEDEMVTSRMAETNALGYGLDTYEVISAEYDSDSDLVEFKADVHLSGEQDDDMGFCGDAIDIELFGRLKYEKGLWVVDDYEIESCEIADY